MDKITIKQKLYEENRLEFKITGVNNTIVNCYRRIVMSVIPIYSFKNITITTNTSIYNNNYIKLRLENMPVIGIKSDSSIFTSIKKKTVEKEEIDIMMEQDDIEMDSPEDLNSSSLKQLTMYVDITNTKDTIITVGTDDCSFYLNEKQIDSPYKKNTQIINLQPKQKIKLAAITEIGTEEISAIFSPVSIFSYKMIDPTTYDVFIESRGQLDEKTLLIYIYDNIINMLNKFIILLESTVDIRDISGKILVDDADHTIGTLIADGLTNHKKVKFAGYNMPHLLDKKILFHYELYKKNIIYIIIKEIVDMYIETFTTINDLIIRNLKIS